MCRGEQTPGVVVGGRRSFPRRLVRAGVAGWKGNDPVRRLEKMEPAPSTCSQCLCWWTVPLSDGQGRPEAAMHGRGTPSRRVGFMGSKGELLPNAPTRTIGRLKASTKPKSPSQTLTCRGHTSCAEVEAPCADACTLLTRWLCARSPQHSYSSLEAELNLFSADVFQGPYPEDSKAARSANRAIVKGTKYKIRGGNQQKKKKFPAWEE